MGTHKSITVQHAIPFVVDETLREGVERSPFPVSLSAKCALLKKTVHAGIREFIVGCGAEVPVVWEQVWKMKDSGELPSDVEPTFIVLLNCWEAAYENFKLPSYPRHWIEGTTFSFGMITYKESEATFDRAVAAFEGLGARDFKASVLNNFRKGFSEGRYAEIVRQIDWALRRGVNVIRINDSVGALTPRITTELASRLVSQYPGRTFCLHAHNDNGLALANTLAAIEAGFQMVEGSLAGFGNRSGIAPLEQVVNLCVQHGIAIGRHPIDLKKLVAAARAAEEVFLAVPNVYRPVGGLFETVSNFGILNVPDFLETGDDNEYFVNYAGLHPTTIRRALERHAPDVANTVNDDELWAVVEALRAEMEKTFDHSVQEYRQLIGRMLDFYRKRSYSTQVIADRARTLLPQRSAA